MIEWDSGHVPSSFLPHLAFAGILGHYSRTTRASLMPGATRFHGGLRADQRGAARTWSAERKSNPRFHLIRMACSHSTIGRKLVGLSGIEPAILYGQDLATPIVNLVRTAGFEPAFSWFQARRITKLSHVLSGSGDGVRTHSPSL